MCYLFKIWYNIYVNVGGGSVRRDVTTHTITIAAFSIEEAKRVLQERHSIGIDISNYANISEIELFSGNLVSRIIRDNGQQYINNMKLKDQAIKRQKKTGTSKTIWGTSDK